jgi:hypothetical protein
MSLHHLCAGRQVISQRQSPSASRVRGKQTEDINFDDLIKGKGFINDPILFGVSARCDEEIAGVTGGWRFSSPPDRRDPIR